MRRAAALIATAAAAAAVVSGCGSSARPGPKQVDIADFAYSPATVTIKTGMTVTFVNHDSTPHTATATATGTFDTGALAQGRRRVVMFTAPGRYAYICLFHAFMNGTIVVQGSARPHG